MIDKITRYDIEYTGQDLLDNPKYEMVKERTGSFVLYSDYEEALRRAFIAGASWQSQGCCENECTYFDAEKEAFKRWPRGVK